MLGCGLGHLWFLVMCVPGLAVVFDGISVVMCLFCFVILFNSSSVWGWGLAWDFVGSGCVCGIYCNSAFNTLIIYFVLILV